VAIVDRKTIVMLTWNITLTVLLLASIYFMYQHLNDYKKWRQELIEYNSKTMTQMFDEAIDNGRLEDKIKDMIEKAR
jgi:hypothetical protein